MVRLINDLNIKLIPELIRELIPGISEVSLENPVLNTLELQAATFQSGRTKPQLVAVNGNQEASIFFDFNSPNNNDAIQDTTINKPIYTEDAINGRPALFGNGSTTFMDIPFSPTINTDSMTLFMVCKVTASTGGFRSPITSRDTFPSRGYIIYATNPANDEDWEGWIGNATNFAGPRNGARPVVLGESIIIMLTTSDSNGPQTLSINGALVDSVNGIYARNSAGEILTRIFAGNSESPTPGNFFPGYIGEILFYSSLLSAGDITKVLDYLSPKWGISLLDVAAIPNISFWGDCSDIPTIIQAGGDVSQLTDKSAAGNDFVQATASFMPKTNTFSQNNRNVIRYDGFDDFLASPGYVTTSSLTVHIVASIISVTGVFDSLFCMNAADFDFQINGDSTSQFLFEVRTLNLGVSAFPVGLTDLADNVFRMYSVKFDFVAHTIELFVNNISIAVAINYNNAISSTMEARIGRNRGNPPSFLNMDLAEMVIINRATTPEEDAEFFDYVKPRWDISTTFISVPVLSGLAMHLTSFQPGRIQSELVTIDSPASNQVSTQFDISNNSNNGTAGPGDQAIFTDNYIDTHPAIFFDGTDHLLKVSPDTTINNIFSGGGTFFAVINPVSLGGGGNGRITDKNLSAILLFDQSGSVMKLQMLRSFSGNDGDWRTVNRDLTMGVGNIIAITYDDSSFSNVPSFYVDGVSVAVDEVTAPTGTASDDSSNDLFIGNNSFVGDRGFDGGIGETMFYNRILTSIEIDNMFQYFSDKWAIALP